MKTMYLFGDKPIAKFEDGVIELLDCDMLFLAVDSPVNSMGPNELNINTINQLQVSVSSQLSLKPSDRLRPHIDISDGDKQQQIKHMF